MPNLIIVLLFFPLAICGAHLVADDFRLMKFYKKKHWYFKPLFACPRCMASVWGGTFYLFTFGLNWWIVPSLFAIAFINSVLMSYYEKL